MNLFPLLDYYPSCDSASIGWRTHRCIFFSILHAGNLEKIGVLSYHLPFRNIEEPNGPQGFTS
jgi:hypothetical protein